MSSVVPLYGRWGDEAAVWAGVSMWRPRLLVVVCEEMWQAISMIYWTVCMEVRLG